MLGWQIFVRSVRLVPGNPKQVLQITVSPALIATIIIVGLFMTLDIPFGAFDENAGELPLFMNYPGQVGMAAFSGNAASPTSCRSMGSDNVFSGQFPPLIEQVIEFLANDTLNVLGGVKQVEAHLTLLQKKSRNPTHSNPNDTLPNSILEMCVYSFNRVDLSRVWNRFSE